MRKRRNRGRGKVIVVTNQKGGVGKTTFAYNLACFANEQGYKVCSVDLDGQGNLSGRYVAKEDRIGGYRAVHLFSMEPPPFKPLATPSGVDLIYSLNRDLEMFQVAGMQLFDAVQAFDSNIEALREDYDYIVIDTPPSYGNAMAAACIVQDYLFVPVELAAFAVEGVVNVVESVKEMGALIQQDLKITGIICNKIRQIDSHADALKNMRAAPGVAPLILKNSMPNRGAVDDAMRDGVPVWKKRSTGAERTSAKEMTALIQEVADLCAIKYQSKGASK